MKFYNVYESLRDKVFRLSMSILKNEQDSEDAVQETFIRVYDNLSKFREESSLQTWIYRICINQCLYMLRKNKKHKKLVSFGNFEGLEYLLNLIEHDEIPEKLLLEKESRREDIKQIYHAIYGLNNEDYRNVVLTKLSIDKDKQAAESLGINYFTYKARLHRAKKEMRKFLI